MPKNFATRWVRPKKKKKGIFPCFPCLYTGLIIKPLKIILFLWTPKISSESMKSETDLNPIRHPYLILSAVLPRRLYQELRPQTDSSD